MAGGLCRNAGALDRKWTVARPAGSGAHLYGWLRGPTLLARERLCGIRPVLGRALSESERSVELPDAVARYADWRNTGQSVGSVRYGGAISIADSFTDYIAICDTVCISFCVGFRAPGPDSNCPAID